MSSPRHQILILIVAAFPSQIVAPYDGVTRITVPNRFIDVTSCRSAGSTVLALDAWTTPRNHRRDCLVVGHVDLDTQGGAVRCVNLDHLEALERHEDIVV